MQENRNNCIGSEKRSTTFRKAKTDKHECQNITATYVAVISYGIIFQSDTKVIFEISQSQIV